MGDNQNQKGQWGQFAILTMAAVAIGCTGIFSQILAGYAEHSCSAGKSDAVAAKASNDDKKKGEAALTNATGENATVAYAGVVALGTGIGIFVNALINKFMPGNGGGGLKSTKSRMLMIMMIAVGMIVIGGISIGSAPATTPEEQALELQRQKQLGGIVMGFGVGLMVPALIKFLAELGLSKSAASDPAAAAAKINKVGVAGGAVLLGIYTTIIGSWAWHNYDSCAKKSGGKIDGHFFATLNSISTVVAAVLTVYCAVYMVFKLRCKVGQPSRSCEIADTMASWSKMKGAAAAAPGRIAASGRAAMARKGKASEAAK